MARAAVKAKQQARGKAQPAAKTRGRGRRKHAGGGNPNQQLFFERMRSHAKWAYVLLAILFAVTFTALGVGSGSNSGLSQLFNGIFGSSSATSISSAQKEVQKNPKSAKAYRDLATAYEAQGQTANAIGALQSLVGIQKRNADAYNELGGLQLQQAQSFANAYRSSYTAQQAAAPSQTFLPTGTLGTAIGTNPIEQAAAQRSSDATSLLYQQTIQAYNDAMSSYQTVAKLRPTDANAQFQIAQVAQAAGDYTTAVAALKKYLVLNPTSPQRAQVLQLIKQLSPAPAKKPKTSSGSGK